jgi:hypothetical protein
MILLGSITTLGSFFACSGNVLPKVNPAGQQQEFSTFHLFLFSLVLLSASGNEIWERDCK